eukprot:5573001-Prymnesium_polylepis.1
MAQASRVLSPPCLAAESKFVLFCNSTGASCDDTRWLSAQQLRRALLPYSWLLFVGDSDTRGLVLSLLQTLAEAGHSRAVAASAPSLWLGNQTDLRYQQASRICHLDWTYGESGRVHSGRAVNCLERNSARSDFGAVQRNQSYIVVGSDYQLEEDASPERIAEEQQQHKHRGDGRLR